MRLDRREGERESEEVRERGVDIKEERDGRSHRERERERMEQEAK